MNLQRKKQSYKMVSMAEGFVCGVTWKMVLNAENVFYADYLRPALKTASYRVPCRIDM